MTNSSSTPAASSLGQSKIAALGAWILFQACFPWSIQAAPDPASPGPAAEKEPAKTTQETGRKDSNNATQKPAIDDGKFFGLEVSNRRTVFVLDYSKSMAEGDRRKVMEGELGQVLSHLKEGAPYQVILFAGFAWIPGDKITVANDHMSAVVTAQGGKAFSWLRPSGATFEWRAVDGGNKHFLRPVPWQKAGAAEIEKTLAEIKDSGLQINTTYQFPLEMALAMQPAPEAIYFLTDGITSAGDSKQMVETVSKKAFSTHTHINTISMMEPKEIAMLKELSKKTDGGFSIINTDGTAQVVYPEKKP